jgi:hypothetical protein
MGIWLHMGKRGQITVFLILAIVIISIAGLLYMFMNSYKEDKLVNTDISPIKTYVDMCLEKSITNGLIYAGRNGGYIYFPDGTQWYVIDPDTKLVVLYNNGQKRLLALPEIERQLGMYVQQEMTYCVDLSTFRKQGYEINETGIGDVNISIMDDHVIGIAEYPLVIRKGESEYRLDRFVSNINVRFGKIYDTANKTLSDIALSDALYDKDFDSMIAPNIRESPLFSLNFILNSYDLSVRYAFANDKITIWAITDEIDSSKYMFNFAAVHLVRRDSNQ